VSILERGDEIERDFYALKAQEWACEPHEAERHIRASLSHLRDWFAIRRQVPAPTGFTCSEQENACEQDEGA
jgi:hypothetical protein